jgi:hypothetical protein
MLLMYADPVATKEMSPSDRAAIASKHLELRTALTSSKELLDGAGLDYAWTTTTLRWDGSAPVSMSGPLTPGIEQLTAYYLVDCISFERASAIAQRLLDFHVTSVEIRRVHT